MLTDALAMLMRCFSYAYRCWWNT